MITEFGDMKYSIGWRTNRSIRLFDKEYDIIVRLLTYREDQELTEKQLEACKVYATNEADMLADMEKLIMDYVSDYKERFMPKMLLVQRNGSVALTCDDAQEPDEGIAVCVYPEKVVLSLDEYL